MLGVSTHGTDMSTARDPRLALSTDRTLPAVYFRHVILSLFLNTVSMLGFTCEDSLQPKTHRTAIRHKLLEAPSETCLIEGIPFLRVVDSFSQDALLWVAVSSLR